MAESSWDIRKINEITKTDNLGVIGVNIASQEWWNRWAACKNQKTPSDFLRICLNREENLVVACAIFNNVNFHPGHIMSFVREVDKQNYHYRMAIRFLIKRIDKDRYFL